jgi:protein-S-isoprenylcysteine O-methyltransferase Ste14
MHMKNPLQLLLHTPVPWVFVLTFLLGVVLEYAAPIQLTPAMPQGGLIVAGGVLFVTGAIVAGWSWFLFRRAGTTRVPGQSSAALITSGPFRITRNPMYVGLALAYIGDAAMLRLAWPVLVLPLLAVYLNWVVVPLEEARLRDVFASTYDANCSTVRRWF